jgi:hypothetical protein
MKTRERDGWLFEHLGGARWYAHKDTGLRFLAMGVSSYKTYRRAKDTDPLHGDWYHYAPHYSTDPEASYEMEEALARRGLDDLYVQALWRVVYGKTIKQSFGLGGDVVLANRGFRFVHASPRQRAEAAHLALTSTQPAPAR